jgi:hypothetical protein
MGAFLHLGIGAKRRERQASDHYGAFLGVQVGQFINAICLELEDFERVFGVPVKEDSDEI